MTNLGSICLFLIVEFLHILEGIMIIHKGHIRKNYKSLTLKECTGLQKFYKEIRILNFEPIVIFCNNQSSMKIVINLQFHAHTNHIKVHYHTFVRNF
jgi:pyruvate-formate lyase